MTQSTRSLEERTRAPCTTGNKVIQKRADVIKCNQNKITQDCSNRLLELSIGFGGRKEFAQSEGVVTGSTSLDDEMIVIIRPRVSIR